MIHLLALLAMMLQSSATSSAVNGAAIVEKAIQAHGGLAALQSVKDITREIDTTGVDPAQGIRPSQPAPQKLKITQVRDISKQRSADITESVPGDPPQHVVQVTSPSSGFVYSRTLKLSQQASPAQLSAVRARDVRRRPEAFLLAVYARPEALRLLGDETFEGRPQHVVAYSDTDGTQLSLSFDAATGLLTKESQVTDDPVRGDTTQDVVFLDYVEISGVKLASRIQDRTAGALVRDFRVTATRINTNPADSLFTMPTEYAGNSAPNAPPAQGTVKMADNIYLVQGAYNSMFAVLPDYVVVLEGPQANAVTQLVLREIKKVAPEKPVKYVVTTHFHHDHISGIREWVSEGVTIVCPPDAKIAIQQAVAAEHKLHPDALSRNPKAPVFEIIDGKTRVFEGGGVRLEVRPISTAHVAEMLVGYFPQQRLLYEADMLSVPATGSLIATPQARDLAQKIESWNVEKIVAVHGGPTTFDALKAAMTATPGN